MLAAQPSLAEIPTMHLNWTVSDTTGVTQFKLYYSYNSDMSGKSWHQTCSTPVEETAGKFSMTCTNIPVNTFPAYIQVSALYTDGSELASNIQTIAEDPAGVATAPTTPSMVQDFRIATTPTLPDGTVFYWAMNLLPETTTISDAGNVTITKHDQDATSAPGVNGNGLEQTGTWQTYRFPMDIIPTIKGTISFWAKHAYPPDINDGTSRYFFRSTNQDKANTIYAYTYKNNIYFYLYDATGALHRTYKVADTWNTGTWYQYSFSWDAATGSMTIKRDGVILSETNTAPWNSALPFWGSQDLYIGYLDPLGSFDEFNITNN